MSFSCGDPLKVKWCYVVKIATEYSFKGRFFCFCCLFLTQLLEYVVYLKTLYEKNIYIFQITY